MERGVRFQPELPDEERRRAEGAISNWQEISEARLENEIDKTPEEIRMIEDLNNYLSDLVRDLGVEGDRSIKPAAIHYLPASEFEKYGAHRSTAFYRPRDHMIIINADFKLGRVSKFLNLFHEILHAYGHTVIGVDKEKRKLSSKRSGYDDTTHFIGLNEAVVNMIIMEVFRQHKQEIINTYNFTEDELKEASISYDRYLTVVKKIISKVSKHLQKPGEKIFETIGKGYFTGNMMHLRVIEDTFGPGALRVLAAMGNEGYLEKQDKFVEYFKSNNFVTRDKIAAEILDGREKEKYLNRTDAD